MAILFLICKVFDNVCKRIIYAECCKIITGKRGGEGSGLNHLDNSFADCICAQYRFLSLYNRGYSDILYKK